MAGQKKSYWCLALFWVAFLGLSGYLWFVTWAISTGDPQYETIGAAFGGVIAAVVGAAFSMLAAAVASVMFLILFFIWICMKTKK